MSQWTRSNLVTVSITGARNVVMCQACHQSEKWPSPYAPVKRPSLKTKGKTEVLLKTQTEFLRYFLDSHLAIHNPPPEGASA